jgi:hypothetical protein
MPRPPWHTCTLQQHREAIRARQRAMGHCCGTHPGCSSMLHRDLLPPPTRLTLVLAGLQHLLNNLEAQRVIIHHQHTQAAGKQFPAPCR